MHDLRGHVEALGLYTSAREDSRTYLEELVATLLAELARSEGPHGAVDEYRKLLTRFNKKQRQHNVLEEKVYNLEAENAALRAQLGESGSDFEVAPATKPENWADHVVAAATKGADVNEDELKAELKRKVEEILQGVDEDGNIAQKRRRGKLPEKATKTLKLWLFGHK